MSTFRRLVRLLHLPLRSCACAVYCCVRKQHAVHAANLSEHVLYYHVWCVPDVRGMCTLHTRGTEPFFFADGSQMPRQIAAVEGGKHDREDSDNDLEGEMAKRPRMEVAAIDTQMPLYEDAGYGSEDRWESDSWKFPE
jgi:hypothetical protein